ncbi:MAG: alpha/beta hydrolase [Rhizobiales bacterium]|nr:alpha/beta hydrolase [Hyphomicrobiales bacterium]
MMTLKWLLIAALAGYGGLLALMYLFQRSLMYFPDTTRYAPAAAGLPQAAEVTLVSADGERLIAWHVPPRGPKPVVLYFQGNAGASNLRAERFAWLTADGTGLLALSYRGYGGSSGKPTEDGLIRDALAAYDFAAARYPAKRIVLWGESLGTAIAIALAAERTVGGVMLDAPFTSAAAIGAAAYPFAPVRWLIKDKFRSDQRIARVSAPLLVLHGERDRVIPIRFGERLFALAREPKRMVRFPNGEHADLDGHGAPKVVKEFLAELP